MSPKERKSPIKSKKKGYVGMVIIIGVTTLTLLIPILCIALELYHLSSYKIYIQSGSELAMMDLVTHMDEKKLSRRQIYFTESPKEIYLTHLSERIKRYHTQEDIRYLSVTYNAYFPCFIEVSYVLYYPANVYFLRKYEKKIEIHLRYEMTGG